MFSNEVLLFVNSITFLKVREKHKLLHECGRLPQLVRLSLSDIESIIQRKLRAQVTWEPNKLLQRVEHDLKWLNSQHAMTISYYSDDYPQLLRSIYDPPILLHVRGSIPQHFPTLAIVGTRRPSQAGRVGAHTLALGAAKYEVPVISGLAVGIDAAVHRGVIDGAGKTIAVLGSGIDQIYPNSNKYLVEKILELGGAIISECSPGTPPLKHHFPARNRIISGLADMVVVVQAPETSGALITADYTLEQGRQLLVHSSGLEEPFEGTKALSCEGAPVVSSFEDVRKHVTMPIEYPLETKPWMELVEQRSEKYARTRDKQ